MRATRRELTNPANGDSHRQVQLWWYVLSLDSESKFTVADVMSCEPSSFNQGSSARASMDTSDEIYAMLAGFSEEDEGIGWVDVE